MLSIDPRLCTKTVKRSGTQLSPSALLPIGTVPSLPATVTAPSDMIRAFTQHRHGSSSSRPHTHCLSMHVCLPFMIPKLTQAGTHMYGAHPAGCLAAMPGHGRPGNTRPLAPLRRVDGPRQHHTPHKKAVESLRAQCEGGREPPTVWDNPHTIPQSRSVLADRNLGLPHFRSVMCMSSHTSFHYTVRLYSRCPRWPCPYLWKLAQSTPHSPQTHEALHPSLKRTPRHCHPRQTRPLECR